MDNKILNSDEMKNVGLKFINERLKLTEEELGQLTFHNVEEINALYISLPTKTGFGLIVGNDGQILYANSSVSLDTHLEEYKKGRRTSLN